MIKQILIPLIKSLPILLLLLINTSHASPSPTDLQGEKCVEKDISNYLWGVRHGAGIPAQIEVEPSTTLLECIILKGVGKYPLTFSDKKIETSLNGSDYIVNQKIQVKDGDTLRFRVQAPRKYGASKVYRLTFKESDPERRRNIFRIRWPVQTSNNSRKPKIWKVGPSSSKYREISDILTNLRAGDTILLESEVRYKPFEAKNISGTSTLPIKLLSDTTDPRKRPVFSGGIDRFDWTIGLTNSHNWIIENVILQDGGICFRHSSNNTTLKKVLIRNCKTGILATDHNSGHLSLYNIEIYNTGGKIKNRPWNHGIYVASDQHTFPGATFTIKNSYLHDNRGNTIKSRFQNTLIANNWIEAGADKEARYLVETIGYDGRYDLKGQHHEISHNVLLHKRPGLGARVGGDGKSPSRGEANFHDNLYLVDKNFNQPLIRTFQGLRALNFQHNKLIFLDNSREITVITDELTDNQWTDGTPYITITNNQLFPGINLLERTAENAKTKGISTINISENSMKEPIIESYPNLKQYRPQTGNYINFNTDTMLVTDHNH